MFSCVFSRFSQSSARWRTAARAQRQRGCTRGCPDIDRLCLLCKKPTQNIATTELMRRRYRWHRVPDSQRRSPQPAVASDSLARRLTVPPPPTSPHPTYPTRPQNQLAQAARAWRRPQSTLPIVKSAGATARAWLTQAVSLPLPLKRTPYSPRPPPSLPRASSGRRRRQLISISVS